MNEKNKIEEWKKRLQDQSNSGLGVTEFCKQIRINVSNFYRWKKRLELTEDEPEFIETSLSDNPDEIRFIDKGVFSESLVKITVNDVNVYIRSSNFAYTIILNITLININTFSIHYCI